MHPLFAKYQTFRINGQTYDLKHLEQRAQSAIRSQKEGWQYSFFKFLTELFDHNDYITANTSGTTAAKKTIYLSKLELLQSARRTIEFLKLKSGCTTLLCLPCTYIAGKMMVVRALVYKHNLITLKPSLTPFYNFNRQINFAALTPQQLIKSKVTLQKRPVDCILVGGAPVSVGLSQQILKLRDTRVYETFGMTETCSNIALRQINPANQPYFKALEGIDLETDSDNCLVLKYQIGSELKKVVTRDIVRLHDRVYFEWLGRADFVINSGGIKHHPEYLERKISQKFQYDLIVSSLPDRNLGQKLVLIIETPKTENISKQSLLKAINNHLSKYEKMHDLFLIPQFKRTPSNKIIRRNLPIKNLT